jgi:hypothetical protein
VAPSQGHPACEAGDEPHVIRHAAGAKESTVRPGGSTGPIGIVRACTDCRAKRSVEWRFDTFTGKEVHSEGLDYERPPPEGSS